MQHLIQMYLWPFIFKLIKFVFCFFQLKEHGVGMEKRLIGWRLYTPGKFQIDVF
jgi:hypothetical protein